ncbi:hypothetical protein WJ966_25765 [Achromobacter xylosoxidans]
MHHEESCQSRDGRGRRGGPVPGGVERPGCGAGRRGHQYRRGAAAAARGSAPPPRVGYVWAPGHWEWVGGRHAWIGGVWMPARPGYVYHGPEWRQRHGHWVYYEGRWGRH